MGLLRVGLSGFSYREWQGEGRFYPPSLKSREYLAYYAERFDCVEMDGTWYRMPSEEAVRAWRDTTPEQFAFCFKMHRQVTHMARLKEEGDESVGFLRKRIAPLGEAGRLGPVLVQLPPNLRRDDARLERFLGALPAGGRWAFEFRHESWECAEVASLLSASGCALVESETDDHRPYRMQDPPFRYARLRKSEYTDEELEAWARTVADGPEAWVFFKHEDLGSAWEWANALITFCKG